MAPRIALKPSRTLVFAASLALTGLVACAGPTNEPAPAPTISAPGPIETIPAETRPAQTPEAVLFPGGNHCLDAWRGGETRELVVDLDAGEFFAGRVRQEGVDVEIEIFGPGDDLDGEPFLWVDTPVGGSGAESFAVVVTRGGPHRLRLRSFGTGELAGRVDVEVEEVRPATPRDREREQARRWSGEAERLRARTGREPERKDETIEAYRRAAEAWRELGDGNEQGRLWMEIGALHWRYGRDAEHKAEAAEPFWDAAEALLDPARDPSYVARLRHYRGEAAYALGRPAEARDHYAAAVATWPPSQATSLAGSLNNLGFTERLGGRPQRALSHYRRALGLWRAAGREREEARTLHNLGKILAWLGDYDSARDRLDEAADTWSRLGADTDLAATRVALGQVEDGLGRTDAARGRFDEALEGYRRLGNARGEAHVLVDLATLEQRAGRLDRADELYQQARPLLLAVDSHKELGRVAAALAQIHLARSRVDDAGHEIAVARRIFHELEDPVDAAGAFGVSSQVALASGDLATAAEYARRAVEGMERVRARPADQHHRAAFLSRVIGVYETAIEIELASGDTPETTLRALEWAERSKGRSFLDELADEPRPLDRARLAQPVERYVVLVYFLGDRASYLWRLDASGLRLWTLAPRERLESKLGRLYSLVSRRPSVETEMLQRRVLRDLGRELLPPDLFVPDRFTTDRSPSRLLVVTDGALGYLPFSALPFSVPEVATGATNATLVERFSIGYAFSLSSWRRLAERRSSRPSATSGTLLVADPVYDRDERCPGASGGENRGGYSRLAGTAEEAAAVAARLPEVDSLHGFDAHADEVRRRPLDRYRNLHFAVHGELDTSAGARPHLVLAQRDRQCRPAPSFLRLDEIFRWRLRSDLVVLSACRSGLGRDLRGEGLVGMTRAFLQAGSSRVVVSLWDVDDRAAAEWMSRFYAELEHHPPDEAARLARLALRARHGDERGVFYWAPFVLYGSPQAGPPRSP